jgi:two-component SAPR family response regulator
LNLSNNIRINDFISDIIFREANIFNFYDLFELEGVSVILITWERGFAIDSFEKNTADYVLKLIRIERE